MGGPIVCDHFHRVHISLEGLWNDLLLNKTLEIYKAFAIPIDSIDLSVSHRQGSKQMQGSLTRVSRFLQLWAACLGRTRWFFALTCLDRGLLIHADQPY